MLVVAHTQKMRIKGAEQRPGKINIATEKIKIKKTAEEKALEMYVPTYYHGSWLSVIM